MMALFLKGVAEKNVVCYNAFKIKKARFADDKISLGACAVHASIVQSILHWLFYIAGEHVFVQWCSEDIS